MDAPFALVIDMASSAAIGLLVGLERERNPRAKAGLRTFALIALCGSLAALLARNAGGAWVLGSAWLAVGLSIAGAHLVDPDTRADDYGTTTVVAALAVFGLGAIIVDGHRLLAVAIGIGVAALLHFKVELEGAAQRLTPTDIRSMLQFGALSAVILPLLPDEPLGPYGAFNPFHVGLMVVVIAGVSLAGYVAWRLTLARKGLLLTGLLGGLVSSTATTLVHARRSRDAPGHEAAAMLVILLANAAMLVRLLVLVTLLSPALAPAAALALLPALAAALPFALLRLRHADSASVTAGEYRNPTQLPTALGFAALYTLILGLGAWLSDAIGPGGVYGLAAVSGLSDVDAITLSSLRLLDAGALTRGAAVLTIAIAVGSNLLFKAALVLAAGSRGLGRATAAAFGPVLLGLAAGAWLALACAA